MAEGLEVGEGDKQIMGQLLLVQSGPVGSGASNPPPHALGTISLPTLQEDQDFLELSYKGRAVSTGQGWMQIGGERFPCPMPAVYTAFGGLKLSYTSSLQPTASTKDLIETCCAAGQQWAIDNDECQGIPENGAESDVCR